MKKLFFGTDGIRGLSNKYPITPDFFFNFAVSLSLFLKKQKKQKIIIGKDTRSSCYMIESALNAGFLSMGLDCLVLGSIPTPVVSFMTKFLKADAGIMISASHNPYFDNGIKVFLKNGEKLTDKQELAIEKILANNNRPKFCSPKNIGRIIRYESNFHEYINNVKKVILKKEDFKNLKMVLDCSNGATYKIAPSLFLDLGIELIPLSISPNGENINKNCGSLSPNILAKKVVASNANLGVSFDGDGDRLVMCDEKGNIIDGDQILALVGKSLLNQKKLRNNCIVSTKMSNLGLENFLNNEGINLFKSNIGDRYVIEMMKKRNAILGGEQSGHIIFSEFSPTGDAMLSTLQILTILQMEQKSLSTLLNDFVKIPQKLINVKVSENPDYIFKDNKLKKLIILSKKTLGLKGNLLLRKSGTEKLLRIMVQSYNEKLMNNILNNIKDCIKQIEIKKKSKGI